MIQTIKELEKQLNIIKKKDPEYAILNDTRNYWENTFMYYNK